jgi:hypothetical protein
MLDKQGYTHAHAPGHPHARKRARPHTNTDKYVILGASPRQLLRERAAMFRYTHVASLVKNSYRTISHTPFKQQTVLRDVKVYKRAYVDTLGRFGQ